MARDEYPALHKFNESCALMNENTRFLCRVSYAIMGYQSIPN